MSTEMFPYMNEINVYVHFLTHKGCKQYALMLPKKKTGFLATKLLITDDPIVDGVKNFINNPTQSQTNQLEVINKISLSMNLSKILKKFLSILVLKRRIFFLEKIIKSFLSLISKKKEY